MKVFEGQRMGKWEELRMNTRRIGVLLMVAGLLMGGSAWGEDNAMLGGGGGQWTALHEFVMFAGFEAHLARLEERLENYQQGQEKAVADRDAAWANRLQQLDANIRERYKTDLQNVANAIRSTYQTNLAAVLLKTQPDYKRYSETLSRCEEGWHQQVIFWGMIGFGGIAIASLVVLCVRTWKNKSVDGNNLYCFEVVLLVAVLVLISVGTFHLLSRIVDGVNGSGGQGIISPDGNKAVLEAYEQLSNELGRWGALIGVLGTFFGLVLPVGGYLLQLKVVKREEEKVETLVDKKLDRVNEQLKQLEIQTEQGWKDSATLQHVELLKTIASLQIEQAEPQNATREELLWIQSLNCILCIIQALTRINNKGFVKEIINELRRDLIVMESFPRKSVGEKVMKKNYPNGKWILDGDINKIRLFCPCEMAELERVLNEDYGIVFVERCCP